MYTGQIGRDRCRKDYVNIKIGKICTYEDITTKC